MSSWSELFSLLSRKDPSGFENHANFDDDIDQHFQNSIDDTLRGSRIWIAYSDSKGDRSERWVRISSIASRKDADYMIGHCELRNESRSFRIDRILEVADNYGEIHDPRQFFEAFISAPSRRAAGTARDSAAGRGLRILDLVGQELTVLAFAAECDGKFVPREANLIVEYAKLRCADLGFVFIDNDIATTKKWIKLLKPDATDLKSAFHNIASKKQTIADELVELAELVFEADAKIKTEEKNTYKLFKELMAIEFKSFSNDVSHLQQFESSSKPG